MTESSAHRISHRHIEVFRAVMTAGSATGAADLLHIDGQPRDVRRRPEGHLRWSEADVDNRIARVDIRTGQPIKTYASLVTRRQQAAGRDQRSTPQPAPHRLGKRQLSTM